MRGRTCFAIVAALVIATPAARAALITVNTTDPGTGGPGCQIRDAITAANTDTATGGCPAGMGADTIELQAAETYSLDTVDNTSANGPNGLPVVTSTIIIEGNGATIERSDAQLTPDFRIIEVDATGDLTVNDVTIRNGKTPDGAPGNPGGDGGKGGGILNAGTLALNHSTVSNNTTGSGGESDEDDGGFGGDGGGIYNSGTLTLHNSTVSGNTTGDGGTGDDDDGNGGFGGGIWNGAMLTLHKSTVGGNMTGTGSPGGGGAGSTMWVRSR
jgi:hypothetical protein